MDSQKSDEICRSEPEQKNTLPDINKYSNILWFFPKALLWGAITYLLGKEFTAQQVWIVVLSVYMFSWPIALGVLYSSTITQIHGTNSFLTPGIYYWFYSRRSLRVLFWGGWALGTSFLMLMQFHTYVVLEWVLFFLVIPVFPIIFSICQRLSAREYKAYLVTGKALGLSRILCAALMVAISTVLTSYFGEIPIYSSLHDAINAQTATVADMTGSAVVLEASKWLATWDGIKAYALGHFGTQGKLLARVVLVVGSFAVFFNACAILSCFLIPRMEYRRVFGPLSNVDQPQPVLFPRLAKIVGIIAFISIFIYFPSFLKIDNYLRNTPEIVKYHQNMESSVVQLVEKIEDAFYKEGTFAQLQEARVDALRKLEVSLAHIEGAADRAFDRMEGNVEGYLDWYYSLLGEYTRFKNMLFGELEEYMINKLAESLQQGDAFNDVQVAFSSALSQHDKAQIEFKQTAQNIMNKNHVDQVGTSVKIVRKLSMKDALNPPVHKDIVGLQGRLFFSGVTGTITAYFAQKIIGKIVGKNVLNLAAKALLKIVASKVAGTAAGTAVGAAVGGTIGSLIPVAGTAAGAAAGGFLGGLVAGVTMDKIVLGVEELVGRDEFKRDILSAIQEARMEFKTKLKEQDGNKIELLKHSSH